MKCSALSFCALSVLVLGVAGCATNDHLVASNGLVAGATHDSSSVAGAPGGGTAAGGAPSGGTSQITTYALAGASGTANLAGAATGGTSQITTNSAGGAPTAAGGSSNTTIAPTAAGATATCETFEDTKTSHPIEVTIRNDRSTAVYIGNRLSQCFHDYSLRVFNEHGQELAIDNFGPCSCGDLMESGCPVYSCSRNPLRRIDANSSLTLTWDGIYSVDHSLPISCQREGSTMTGCSQRVAADPGKYKLMVTGSSEYGCAEGWDPSNCSCMETNSCTLYVGPPLEGRGELLNPSVEFDLMSTNKVTVTFTESTETVPRKNGVPIGDCKERTSAEQLALGCPVAAPEPMSACNATAGTTCSYAIDVSTEKYATQDVYICGSTGIWQAVNQGCAENCGFKGTHVTVMGGNDCSLRPMTSCPQDPNVSYTVSPSAQSLMDHYLTKAIASCIPEEFRNSYLETELELENGCATNLFTMLPLSAAEATCFQKQFEAVRLDCAMPLTCGRFGTIQKI